MNCTYRSIWNDSTGTFVAVSENAKSAGKKTSSCNSATAAGACFTLQALAISVALTFGGNAIALPAGGVVAAGGASISTVAGNTTINQSTQNAVINWQSFNVASGEAVRFVQPNSNSVLLNRVLGADPSNILGSLTANGKVFLVNPNGILFGQGASVNVGGLVASTLNIADGDFMAGNYKFSGAGNGTVLNQGSINTDGGYVALLGANVRNDGVIAARLGTVALAAGNAMTLDVAGDGLLNVTVNQGAVNALVQNGGLIQADGGQVLLTAQAAGSLLSTVVNNTGVIRAQTLVTGKDGSIKLMGDMQSGTVNVGGVLDASAPNGGNGGFIETSAAHVMIASDAKVSTAAPTGLTGTWLIDPQDFTIGSVATDNISGATLSALLVTNSVVITTATGPRTDVAGTPPVSTLNTATPGNGDINVNEAVSWTATPSTTTLSLNAARDVNVNAAITATNGNLVVCCGRDANVKAAISTTNGSVLLSAGHNINLDPVAAITATDGNIAMGAGRDINVGAKITLTRGSSIPSQSLGLPLGLTLSAGNDGTGPGVAGGTVVFAPGTPAATVAGPNAPVTINYNPVSYTAPTNYSTNFELSLGATLTQHMLAFVQGNDKVYDGNTTANLSFKGDPTVGGTKQVTLVSNAGATATFDDKNVASNIGITYSGYTLGGLDAGLFALPVFYCTTLPGRTSANITPAPLTLKASDATKVYGQTFAPSGTAFTVLVPPVAGETVTVVTETSSGSTPTASVAGSTYPIVITPGSATGTNFNQANYVITYQPGALTVTPLPVVVPPVTPPVVVPPVETTPLETKPIATPPELPYEGPIVMPGVGAPTWMPVVVPPGTPPQLLTLAPPVLPVVVAPELVVEQPPVIAPPESPPSIYVAPHRPRKQDRN
ncbi:filamentous hemagglutinin N-terminal domain-containing protein [Rhodoferax ferrireducens]|uniref:two-partner secretion domain-containing protein n=1 Tax=Rhodoferax ferrireducens TaxID=192843 RepID=UPI00298DEF35|nr:filamentous hemagglutinin N-terminal domain-containing protein [Rhodoferax ferrireducens]WPC66808.1 filamentous hemagglutinin N-terminal domain-containing protein [Rhodoferax ferrireducens]